MIFNLSIVHVKTGFGLISSPLKWAESFRGIVVNVMRHQAQNNTELASQDCLFGHTRCRVSLFFNKGI